MASKKRRKKKDKVQGETQSLPSENTLTRNETTAEEFSASASLKQAPIKKVVKTSRSRNPGRKGVTLLTCAAGMFLTFILGLYIGTLIPGIQNEVAPHYSSMPAENIPVQNAMTKVPDQASEKISSLPDSVPHDVAHRIDLLESEVAKTPSDSSRWTELGNLYFDVHLPERAIGAYEKSLAINPDNPDVWTDLGIMYREKDEFIKAVECFRRASGINPSHENALYNEGIVLATDLHNKNEAMEAWRKLLSINPAAHSPDGMPVSEMIKKLQ